MKRIRLLGILLISIFICTICGLGQYSTPTGYSTSAPVTTSPSFDYSQYYTMGTGSAPSYHVSTPVTATAVSMPTTVYLSNQMQPVSLDTYRSSAPSNTLWIQGTNSWSQYASVPQGATVPLLAITSSPGNGYLTFVDASGQTYSYNYYFYPSSSLTFYADLPGRHILSFTVNGVTSNQVIIDVVGQYAPNNYLPPRYGYGYGYGYPLFGFGENEEGGEREVAPSGERTESAATQEVNEGEASTSTRSGEATESHASSESGERGEGREK